MADNGDRKKRNAGNDRGRQLLRKGLRPGQALVEFAVVAPLMVTLLLFSIYFYEINHVKLKVQEMARYAAWEFTGHPLHDYSESNQSSRFGTAKSKIQTDALDRYKNLKSTDDRNEQRYLAVGWRDPDFSRISDKPEPRIPSGNNPYVNFNTVFTIVSTLLDLYSMLNFTHANPTLTLMIFGYYAESGSFAGARLSRTNPPGHWGFNTKGYPKVTVTLNFENQFLPRRFMDGAAGWFGNEHMMASRFRFKEEAQVVADSWRLHYGESVTNDSSSSAFYKTVDRMAFVTPRIKDAVRGIGTAIKILVASIALAALTYPTYLVEDPVKTALVSKQYSEQDPESGRIMVNEDQGPQYFDTAPNMEDSQYRDTFTQRGKYHMGCREPERLTCGPGLSTENPFGDYVYRPAE